MHALAGCACGAARLVRPAATGQRAAKRDDIGGVATSKRKNRRRQSCRCGGVAKESVDAAAAGDRTEDDDDLAAWVAANGGDIAAVCVGTGARGRGLFAARDISKGEAVLSVPISASLNDGVAPKPYPGAPWSVTLAAAILRERDLGESSSWGPYISSLPKETIGFANSPEAAAAIRRDDAGALDADEAPGRTPPVQTIQHPADQVRWMMRGDAAAADEMARYATLVDGAHSALTMMRYPWSAAEWRWAMSQVHSRTFRVEDPAQGRRDCATRRLMVPFVDLLNHDSREDVWQCGWGCEWDLGGGDGTFVVRAERDVRAGEEMLISYGERCDRHFFLFFGFLPEPNPHNTVALFNDLEEAAEWYEALCGDDGEEAMRQWAAARSRAVARVRAEEEESKTQNTKAKKRDDNESPASDKEADKGADAAARDEDEDAAGEEKQGDPTSWTSADAEAEEAAALNVGVGASVDERLLRLFDLLSGDPHMAEQAVRVRAAQLLDACHHENEDEGRVHADARGATEAAQLAAGYRARRRTLLLDIA